jgi:hypothetical protein
MSKRRTRNQIAISFVLLSAATFGSASIGYLKRGWKSGSVKTCWTDDMARFKNEVKSLSVPLGKAALPDARENDEIQNWISAAYNKARVGVEFVGFSDCTPGAKVDALMLYNANLNTPYADHPEKMMIVRGLGSPGNFSSSASMVNRITNFLTRKPVESGVAFNRDGLLADVREIEEHMARSVPLHIIPETRGRKDLPGILARFNAGLEVDVPHWAVLHEFGHLAGLLHEERRKDLNTEQPGYCGGAAGDAFLEGTEANKESRFGTDFDPFSVMNYCRQKAQVLYHEAVMVCEIGDGLKAGYGRLTGAVPASLEALLANCGFIQSHTFAVDLTPRDVAGLRNLYLKELPAPGPSTSYKASEDEKKWAEIFLQTSRLYL